MADPDFLQPPPMRTIETERLRLRTVTLQDLDALMPLITDRETMKFTYVCFISPPRGLLFPAMISTQE